MALTQHPRQHQISPALQWLEAAPGRHLNLISGCRSGVNGRQGYTADVEVLGGVKHRIRGP